MSFDIWLSAVKLIHIASISIWIGGLLAMPYLTWQRHGLLRQQGREAVHRLHRMVRMLHVNLVSPFAVLAIGTGIALIFMRETYGPWFTLKMAFVAVLVLAHNLANRTQRRVFADDPVEGDALRGTDHANLSGMQALALGVMIAIGSSGVLVAVLAKPDIHLRSVAPELFTPGALGQRLGPLNPFATD
ncbi:MAG: CopD family protein [Paracoccus sp. (in: a-proteobacteria)]|nr:CopD family protein [Paracoccus sp. (in: a-proteobacteria)]